MLEIRHLRKSFGSLVSVEDVSFALDRGHLVGLLGPNGAGKTTTVFIFPAWLQQFSTIIRVRWAVDGLDAMTWRGIGLSGAIMPTLVMLGFAAAFAAIAAWRLRWEEAGAIVSAAA